MTKQSIKDGSKVTFNSLGMEEDFKQCGMKVKKFENKEATVSLATFTELGEKDFEYYDLEFQTKKGVKELFAVSGYHLTEIN